MSPSGLAAASLSTMTAPVATVAAGSHRPPSRTPAISTMTKIAAIHSSTAVTNTRSLVRPYAAW
jgi:hypothetical protein